MATIEYDTEEEFNDAFERIEGLNFEHLSLKEAVEEAEKDLERAQQELHDFEEENKDVLVG